MITPAQRARSRGLAKKAGGQGAPSFAATSARELMLAKLDSDKRRLKQIQSVERKIEVKRELLPDYAGWIAGTLEADAGEQDEVLTTIMVWEIDVGEFDAALTLAAHALRHKMSLPDHYKRSLPCLVAEEIADAALRAFATTEEGFPLAVLTRALATVRGEDMPDEVRAKLAKAEGLAQEKSGKLECALASLQKAFSLHDKIGVKKDIERVKRALKNAAPDPAKGGKGAQ